MAEHVQAALDEMVLPLKDLLERGIFSQREIQQIVERRRSSEYLLRRRAARKDDFLSYIQAEQNLERLRHLRTSAMARKRQDRKNVRNKTNGGLPIGEVHIVQLIHLLFTRALRKFRSDVDLHLLHAAFAKECKSNHKLTTIYTEALQVHPRHVGLWIEAASHEYFGADGTGGGSMQAARILFQRGLRINPKAKELWIQYFCLEMHHIQKLRGRREILQIEETTSSTEADASFRDAPIAKIVYNNAIKEIPDSVDFRLEFLETLSLFPQTESLERHIESTLERDFEKQPQAWIARAAFVARKQEEKATTDENVADVGFVIDTTGDAPTRPSSAKKQRKTSGSEEDDDAALTVLSDGMIELPTTDMYIGAIQFARGYLDQFPFKERVVTEFLQKLFDRARDKHGIVTAKFAVEHADYLASNGKVDTATHILKDYVTQSNSDDVETSVLLMLVRLLRVEDRHEEAIDELTKGLEKAPFHHADYTKILLDLFGAKLATNSTDIKPIFEKLLLLTTEAVAFEPAYGITSLTQACLAYLVDCRDKDSSDSKGNNAKAAVRLVLESSSFCESAEGKSNEELEMMVQVFEEAIKGIKSEKLLTRRVYEKAISFFSGWAQDLSDSFRAQRDEFLYA